MKQLFKPLLTALLLLCSIVVNAHDFKVDGIYYNILSVSDLTVEVVEYEQQGTYSSYDIVIPSEIIYNNTTYQVTRIGNLAFSNAYYSLSSITIPNSVTSIGDYAFRDCCGLGSIIIPNSVTSIGDYAFENCCALQSIIIPNNVTNIGEGAFRGCFSLQKIEVENGNTKYDSRDSCNAIIETATNTLLIGCKNTIIPNNIASIGNNAFNHLCLISGSEGYCYIKRINIPNSVTSIGASAFANCKELRNISIPSSITSIELDAFSGCTSLTSIIVNSENSKYDSRNVCNAIIETTSETLIIGCKNTVIPNSVTSIGDRAFYDCTGLTSIEIPNSVTSIGSSAFRGCSSLTSIEIPNSVTSIGRTAFYGCSSLTSIIIPNSVTNIGEWAFSHCSSLTSVRVPNNVTSIGDYVFNGCSNLTSITIPNSVTSIGNDAFHGCSSLTSIEIPNSVTSIGKSAFSVCSSLKEVHINDLNAWCKIDFSTYDSNPLYYAKNLFLNSNKLFEIIIPDDITEIKRYTFYNCSSITSVTIPNNITSIGSSAFDGCTNLEKLYLGNSIEEIGFSAFASCTSLTSITIPNSVTSIGSSAFSGCTSLTSIIIPNSVTNIGDWAFYGCEGLTSITIGSAVRTIGRYVFSNCYYITDIYCYAAIVPSTDITAFKGSYPEYVTLHVPAVAINRYKTTEPWSNFGTITALDGFSVNKYLLTYKVDGETYANDSIEYGAAITPIEEPTKEGHTFSGWSEIPATMPANDVVVEGTFSINSYTVTFMVDGEVYDTMTVEYGATIEPIEAPTKEGHTFSGWSDIPTTMPAEDIIVTAQFSVNSYTVSFMVDGEVYKSLTVKYGDSIPAVEVPTLDGYIFDSWDEIPSIMPAEDIIIESYWLIPGDVNNDGRISVLDITILTNHILRINDNSIFKQQAADMNSDGRISIVDVTKVTNKILE